MFLLLLTTSASTCLKHSRNLEPTFSPYMLRESHIILSKAVGLKVLTQPIFNIFSQAKEHLQSAMAAHGEEVMVNVLGFNEHHDDAFLESLSLLGTSDGSYRHGILYFDA